MSQFRTDRQYEEYLKMTPDAEIVGQVFKIMVVKIKKNTSKQPENHKEKEITKEYP